MGGQSVVSGGSGKLTILMAAEAKLKVCKEFVCVIPVSFKEVLENRLVRY